MFLAHRENARRASFFFLLARRRRGREKSIFATRDDKLFQPGVNFAGAILSSAGIAFPKERQVRANPRDFERT